MRKTIFLISLVLVFGILFIGAQSEESNIKFLEDSSVSLLKISNHVISRNNLNSIVSNPQDDEVIIKAFVDKILASGDLQIKNGDEAKLFVFAARRVSKMPGIQLQYLNLSFTGQPNDYYLIEEETSNSQAKINHISLFGLKSRAAKSIVNEILKNFVITELYLDSIDFLNQDGEEILPVIENTSAQSLETLSFIRMNLSKRFIEFLAIILQKLRNIITFTCAKCGLTNFASIIFSENTTIRKYYLPKNHFDDYDLLSLLQAVQGQFKNKVEPWVIDVAYNEISFANGNLYSTLEEIGKVKNKNSSFTFEIYKNPLTWNEQKKANLENTYGMLFNDFDNEGEWDDL